MTVLVRNALLLSAVTSCLFGQTGPKKVSVVLDNWWTIDFVKNGCGQGNPYGTPCPKDRTPEEVVREFEDELAIVFASENACHDVQLIRFTPEMAKAAVKNPRAPASGTM